MDDRIRQDGAWDLRKMAETIADIEMRINELRQLGARLPAVEKNTRNMLNCIYVLKFGISNDPSLLSRRKPGHPLSPGQQGHQGKRKAGRFRQPAHPVQQGAGRHRLWKNSSQDRTSGKVIKTGGDR